MKKTAAFGMFLLFFAVSGGHPARGWFVVEPGLKGFWVADIGAKNSEGSKKSVMGSRIIHIGVEPGKNDIAPARGLGDEIPLSDAVQQILPEGWSGFYESIDGQNILVSWTGAPRWTEALGRLMEDVDGKAKIDWNRKAVTIAVNLFAGLESTTEEPPVQIWEIRISDGTLKGALERWGRETVPPMQVSWEAKNFPAEFEAKFPGSFKEAVAGVVKALSRSDAPVEADFYQNAVRIYPIGTKRK